jgi:hypothetical protein
MMPEVSLAGATPDAATVDQENPWPGLEAYREADKEFFHGRIEESDELLRSVLRAQLTVFFGKSGLGKTSLLQAGLFPRLREQSVIPIYIRLAFSPDRPSLNAQVKNAISKAAAAMSLEAPPAKENETLWEYFHRQEADFWNERNQIMVPVLVFDQFEEIFTKGRGDANRVKASEAFLVELGDLIEGRPPATLKEYLDANPQEAGRFSFSRHNYRIVISLREDFLPELEGLKERIPSLYHNRLRLLPMNGEAACNVVAQAQVLIKPDVAEKVVRFVAAEERLDKPQKDLVIEPALLSVVCRELNNKRKELKEPRISADLLEGSQKEILDGFYERSVAGLPLTARTFIEERMVNDFGYRESVALESALRIRGFGQEVIDRLVERRLIRKEEREGRERLELTHDLLAKVIVASRDRRRQLEQQQEIAAQKFAKAEKRIRRIIVSVLGFAVIIGIASLWFLYNQSVKERLEAKDRQTMLEKYKNEIMETKKELIEKQNQRIKESFNMRQAVLSYDNDAFERALKNIQKETKINFKAKAKYLYKSNSGKEWYRFKMYPSEQSKSADFGNIALITYIMYKQTFSSPLIVTGPNSDFTGTYEGIGCLSEVTALIEYKNPERPMSYAQFNMCDIVEGYPRKR